VLSMGCWSPVSGFSIESETADWFARSSAGAAARFQVKQNATHYAEIDWQCIGKHNMQNALAAIVASRVAGVSIDQTVEALAAFRPSARRMERMAETATTILYQDFAHHPTAIKATLEALRVSYPDRHILAIIEPRSNTMQMGHHGDHLGTALKQATETWFYTPDTLGWQPESLPIDNPVHVINDSHALIHQVLEKCKIHSGEKGNVIIAMSNGGFDGILSRITGASLFALLLMQPALAQSDRYVEGGHYELLGEFQPVQTGDKIEVVEMFWYRCPHCYRLEPYLEKWLQNKPENAEYVPIPALLNNSWAFQARAFYTFEALGMTDQLHAKFFDAIHKERRPFNTADQLAEWAKEYGADPEAVKKTMDSFAVNNKLNFAALMSQKYGITGVPAMIVDGKYRTNVSMAGSHEELFNVINYLIEKAAAERQS